MGKPEAIKKLQKWQESQRHAGQLGGANNKNPISIIVPCHRVIGANGSLVGYGGELNIKKALLDLEKEDVYV